LPIIEVISKALNQRDCSRRPEQLDCEPIKNERQGSQCQNKANAEKAKFSTRLRSKGDTAQVNEALCKVLCHNICVLIQSMFELGIAPTFCGEIAIEG